MPFGQNRQPPLAGFRDLLDEQQAATQVRWGRGGGTPSVRRGARPAPSGLWPLAKRPALPTPAIRLCSPRFRLCLPSRRHLRLDQAGGLEPSCLPSSHTPSTILWTSRTRTSHSSGFSIAPLEPRKSARWRTSTATAASPVRWRNLLIARAEGILPSGEIDQGRM